MEAKVAQPSLSTKLGLCRKMYDSHLVHLMALVFSLAVPGLRDRLGDGPKDELWRSSSSMSRAVRERWEEGRPPAEPADLPWPRPLAAPRPRRQKVRPVARSPRTAVRLAPVAAPGSATSAGTVRTHGARARGRRSAATALVEPVACMAGAGKSAFAGPEDAAAAASRRFRARAALPGRARRAVAPGPASTSPTQSLRSRPP
jgi:hypothetical protein